ncbi:MAG: AAA family ATPase [Chloroflexota bacterium]
MIRRSILLGTLGGCLMSLAGLYPAVALLAPLLLPNWNRPIPNELVHGLFLMLSAVVGMPVLLGLGIFVSSRTKARDWQTGAKFGGLAGAVAGVIVFMTLVSPLNALLAYGQVVRYTPSLTMPLPPVRNLMAYISVFESGRYLIELTILVMIALGAAQGAFWGWRKRQTVPRKSRTLYRVTIAKDKHPREWFRDKETASRAGLLVGLGVAVLLSVTLSGQLYAGIAQGWPELADIIRLANVNLMIEMPERGGIPFLDPLVLTILLSFGLLVVALAPNPPDRFRSRIRGVILAANIILLAFWAFGLRVFYFNMGLSPFWVFRRSSQGGPLDESLLIQAQQLLDQPGPLIVAVLLTPWLLLGLTIVLGWLIGIVQGSIYTLLLTAVYRRPVDRAVQIYRQLQREPNEVLPIFHELFTQAEDAYDVLVHISILTYEKLTAVSHLAASYHTLGTSKETEDHLQTIVTIQDLLDDHPDWHWVADFGEFYHALNDVLAARTLEQILAIQSPPAQQTSTLPVVMAQSVERMAQIVNELQKIKKVEDLSTQLIFLENAQEAIYGAQQFVRQELTAATSARAASLPERTAFDDVLEHWQQVLMKAIRRLKGRASITSTLTTQSCNYTSPLPLVWRVSNQGLNVAQEVRLRLLPNPGYELTEQSEESIEILAPGEEQHLQLLLRAPEQTQRLRVEWQVLFDDAVDDDRSMVFADVVDFTVPDKPFERIFPIPYVTGTPLKTNNVFVGREDVFAFIRENLLGAHQNNVIILHGQRRTGKTSVLYRLGQAMSDTHYGVLIDMQGKPARGEADFLFSIADDIVFALEDAEIDVEYPERADFEEAPEFYFRSRFLRGLSKHLNGKNLLLMFDEFEELQRRVENGRLQPEIFQFLRNLMQHEKHVDFIFSGTHKLEDLGATYWSVLFNIASYKPITFLSSQEIDRLIHAPVADYPIEYDPLAIARISEVTAGHPYFTQLVLHEMIVYYNEMQVTYLTIVDVDQVLKRIIERGEAHFKYIWAESSAEERQVLQAAAELLATSEVVSQGDLVMFMVERGCQSDDRWQAAFSTLRGRDILTTPNAKSSLYRFKVDLVRRWIDTARPAL